MKRVINRIKKEILSWVDWEKESFLAGHKFGMLDGKRIRTTEVLNIIDKHAERVNRKASSVYWGLQALRRDVEVLTEEEEQKFLDGSGKK